MTRRILEKDFLIIGFLLIVCSFGLFKGNGTVVAHADNDTDIYFGYNIYFQSENDSTNKVWLDGSDKPDILPSSGVKMPDSYSTGATYKAFLKEAIGRLFNEPYMIYDVLNTYFDYSNKVIDSDTAISKLTKILSDSKSVPDLKTLNDIEKNYFSTFPNTSIDMGKTLAEAEEFVVPEKMTHSNLLYTYKIPNFTIYVINNNYTMTIKYVLPDGTAAHEDTVVHGYAGKEPATVVSPSVNNYVPDQKEVNVSFAKDGAYVTTVHYTTPSSQTGTSPSTDLANLTADTTATVTVGQKVTAATFNATATDSNGKSIPVTVDTNKANLKKPGTYTLILKAENGKTKTVTLTVKAAKAAVGAVAPKKSAVYGLKKLYLYQKSTFNKTQRIAKYVKVPRTDRPMFVVIGYGYSQSGLRRYHVKDVNQNSKTAGETGYITARKDFVDSVYYQKAVQRIKVVNKHGVNLYKNSNLTKQMKHVKRDKTLKVVALKKHNLTTRFVLNNGQYVTANKKLVTAVK